MRTRNYTLSILLLLFFACGSWAEVEDDIEKEPRYNGLPIIGAGTYGVVCQKDNHVIKISAIDYDDATSRNILEAAVFRALDHKSIPKPLFIDIYQGLEKQFLEIHLPHYSDIKSKDAASILKSMASVLDYIHDLNIAHRDIKRSHMLFHQGSLVLIDWGNADVFTGEPSESCGTTMGYCSPGLLLRDYQHPKEDDMWASGISTLEMVHDIERLFVYHKESETLNAIFSEKKFDPLYNLATQWKNNNFSLSPIILNLVKNAEPASCRDHLLALLEVCPMSRPTSKQLLARFDRKANQRNQPMALLEQPIFNKTSSINSQMRRVAYLWLHDISRELEMPDKVLFEAMSIGDQFIKTGALTKNNLQLAASIALYLAADFYMSGHDIETFVRLAKSAFSEDDFKETMVQLLQYADFNLLFRHTLREYQSEIYRRLESPKAQQIAILLLTMLEIDEKTFTLSNAEKWALAKNVSTRGPTNLAPESKRMLTKLCQKFANEALSQRPYFSDLYQKPRH